MYVFTLSLLQFHFELLPLTRSAQNYGEVRREAFIYSFGCWPAAAFDIRIESF